MAVVGLVVPEGNQAKEGFHGLRRTTEGLLYYTKVDKDSTESVDFEGGTPSDLTGTGQISRTPEYTNETTKLQTGATQIFTGDGSTMTFSLTTPVLDGTRIAVFVNGVEQDIDVVWTYASGVVTFKIAPYNNAQVAIGYIDKQYKNNANDFYHQFRMEPGDATYFIDDNGYFIKRENRSRGATAITTDDFDTLDSLSTVVASTWSDL